MNDDELKRRLEMHDTPDSSDILAQIKSNIHAYTNTQPTPKRHTVRLVVLSLCIVLAVISTVASVLEVQILWIALAAVISLSLPMAVWYTGIHKRFNMQTLALPLWTLAVVGVLLTTATTTFAAVNAPNIYAKLTSVVSKEVSDSQHNELGFSVNNCPRLFGSDSNSSRQERYALSNKATLSDSDAEKVIQAECISQAASVSADRIWNTSITTDDPSLRENSQINSFSPGIIQSIESINSETVVLGNGFAVDNQAHALKAIKVIDMNGTTIDLAQLHKGDIVLPVMTETMVIHMVDNNKGGQSAVPSTVEPFTQRVVGLVKLPGDVAYRFYDAELRSQLLIISPCLNNVDDDCVANVSPDRIILNDIQSQSGIQGRVLSKDTSQIIIKSEPSNRQFIIKELDANDTAGIQVGDMLDVAYLSTSEPTVIYAKNVAALSIVTDQIKKNDTPTNF